MTSAPVVVPAGSRRAQLVRAFALVVAAILVLELVALGPSIVTNYQETARSTARYDPPVLAGQIIAGRYCTGGFYARTHDAIVMTFPADCAPPGTTIRDSSGNALGVTGPEARLGDCPAGRKCLASDFLALTLGPDWIPWGHLNVIDMGAGGYHVIEPGTAALHCGDMHVGDSVAIDGREHYRTGTVTSTGRYENTTDIIFPCMVVANIEVLGGDSGGAVLVNGFPGGSTSRQINCDLGFTPLAEGLEYFGLTLCTTPNCDLTPPVSAPPRS